MKITKLEHSGLAIEKNGKILLFDPIEITEKLPDFRDVAGIIITHPHSDHFQPAVLERILSENPEAILILVTKAEEFPAAKIMRPGDEIEIGDFSLTFFGSANHAEIIPGQVPCANLGVMVDGLLANPGDSFDEPPIRPKVLLAALSAPWCKPIETLDYIKKVHPEKVIPVHDAVLSSFGKQVNNNWIRSICEAEGIEYLPLNPEESVTISG